MASPRILRHAREPIFLLDARRRLIYANPAWEELTGVTLASALGGSCDAHGPTTPPDVSGMLGSFCPPPEALNGQPTSGPTLILRADGQRFWRSVDFWAFHNARGMVFCLLGIIRPEPASPKLSETDTGRLRVELLAVREQLLARHGSDALIGQGPSHRRLLNQVVAASSSELTVTLVGEPGTGKNRVAREIHNRSNRAAAPLIAIDCAALPPQDLERTLFGPIANKAPRTALDLPVGSTLLLSNALDLPRDIQARLASALDGDVRLLATAAADPAQALRDNRLRPDLYYGLTGLVLTLLPLRERLDELPTLAQHFLERANLRGARQRFGFAEDALAALLSYDWPGNLRELARIIESAHNQGEGDLIARSDLPNTIRGNLASAYNPPPMPTPVTPLDDLLTQLERRLIDQALRRARHNKSKAADLLAISRPRLYRRIKELELPDLPETRDETTPET